MYNKILQKILENENYYAHVDSSGYRKEPLPSHLDLTLKYYHKMSEYKNLEHIIKNMIKLVSGNISDVCVDKVYEMFLNAIYYHDIGKINPKFQIEKMKNNIKKDDSVIGSKHSMLSAKLYINIFEKEIMDTGNRDFKIVIMYIYYLGYVISKHHSKIDNMDSFFDDLDELDVPKCCENIINTNIDRKNVMHKLVQTLNVDEIGIYILVKLFYSILISADYYATYEFMSAKEINFKNKDINLFKKYENSDLLKNINLYKNGKVELNSINALRSDIFIEAENSLVDNMLSSSIFYLEAPTGSGKTNTSINLARQVYKVCPEINSINYIFPFNTLIEQTQGVFENYFEINRDFVVINNVTPIWDEGDDDIDYEKVYIDNLFRNYPITLTSHVNLFNSLFGITKDNNFSLVDYCNSVVVLDEIQVYKNKIWKQILTMLEKYAKLLNMKIIIMSATLPNLDMLSCEKGYIKSCNLVHDVKKFYDNDVFKNRVEINYELLGKNVTLEDLKIEVLKYTDKKVLIEFIKKQDARDFYNLLKEENLKVFEITGDDNNYSRKKTLNAIKHETSVIVVCTQTIEAGVDIDMDIGFKDISFIDSEEQFLGRINRNSKKQGCKAFFFNYTDAKKVYFGDRRIGYDLLDKNLQKVLVNKEFANYFNKLIEKINSIATKNNKDNIKTLFEWCKRMDFKNIYENLKLIDSDAETVFFNFTCIIDDEKIVGADIWREYCDLFYDRNISYAEKQIKLSNLKKYMSIFTYNIDFHHKNRFYTEKNLGIMYVENGDEFFEDGKFDRKKYLDYLSGNFI